MSGIDSKPFNGLTPAQAELLALLSEECNEVGMIVGKILRHGALSYHPDRPETTNYELLIREVGDVLAAVHLLHLPVEALREARQLKLEKVGQYLHHNKVHLPREDAPEVLL